MKTFKVKLRIISVFVVMATQRARQTARNPSPPLSSVARRVKMGKKVERVLRDKQSANNEEDSERSPGEEALL